MKTFLLFISLSVCTISSAQVTFDTGYYITNNGERIDGFVKNLDRLQNPNSISFKKNQASEGQRLDITNIKEFGILDGVTYIRATVSIDISSNDLERLSETRSPQFQTETLFLKKRLDGKASLYEYNGKGVLRYFYSIDNSLPKQLVYKRFSNLEGKYGVNEQYKQQLKNELACTSLKGKDYSNLFYKDGSLLNFFKKYNTCTKSEVVLFNKNSDIDRSKSDFKIRLKIGARKNNAELNDNNQTVDFDGNTSLQASIEGEYIFGFNRNKWSALLDISYFSYQDNIDTQLENTVVFRPNTIDYSAIELNAGIRHSFFINNNLRLFLNINYIRPINLNQSITQGFGEDFDKFINSGTIGLGGGAEWKKFSFNLLAQSERVLTSNGSLNKYSNLSASLGYVIF